MGGVGGGLGGVGMVVLLEPVPCVFPVVDAPFPGDGVVVVVAPMLVVVVSVPPPSHETRMAAASTSTSTRPADTKGRNRAENLLIPLSSSFHLTLLPDTPRPNGVN